MQPLVSVIIPVYNSERFIGEAIESVLAQRHRPVEVIVVDDGSVDNTALVCRQYASHIRYFQQQNQGAAAARNTGAAHALGEFLGFLDADDLWSPEKLTLQLQAFDADPALEAVFCHVQQFVAPRLQEGSATDDGKPDSTARSDAESLQSAAMVGERSYTYQAEIVPGYHVDALLIRMAAFVRVGGFDAATRYSEIVEWYARAVELGLRMQMLPDVLVHRRIHGNNLGIRHYAEARTAYLRTLREIVERRRRDAGAL